MTKNAGIIPTEAELSILNVLWKNGPSTVREVQHTLNKTRKSGYTTVLKMLQIMTQKKLVKRDESKHAHVYFPTFSKQETQKRLVNDLLKKAFGGSSLQLVSMLFGAERLSKSEFERIKNELLARRKADGEDESNRSD